MNNKRVRAELTLLLVAVLWGGGFVAVKDALDAVTPFYMIGIRFTIAAFILVMIFRHRVWRFPAAGIKAGLIIGFFLFAAFALQTIGLQYTLPGKQAFLTGIYVIMVPFLYWLVRHKPPGIYAVIAAFLTLIGIALITLEERFVLNSGDWLTLLCDIGFAAHIIAIDKYAKHYDAVVLAIVQMLFAGVMGFVCGGLFEPSFAGKITADAWFPLLYMTLFSTMAAFLLQNIAQCHVKPTQSAIILCLESVFGTILSVIIMQEPFGASKIIGCAVIFLAVVLAQIKPTVKTRTIKSVQDIPSVSHK